MAVQVDAVRCGCHLRWYRVSSGLEGVVAATTPLTHVRGEPGELVIVGSQIQELAEHATLEETMLLWNGDLPSAPTFRGALAGARGLPASIVAVLRECAHRHFDVMDALRVAAGMLSMVSDEATGIVARAPTIIASYWRRGQEPLVPRTDLGHAANFRYSGIESTKSVTPEPTCSRKRLSECSRAPVTCRCTHWLDQWRQKRFGCSRCTSQGNGCKPTWSSTRRCCCTASDSTRRCLHPPSSSAA